MFINRGKKVDMNNKETQESNTVKNESKTVIKKAVSIIGLLFISTIIIYFLFSLYFINHLYFNTTINNDNFQLLSADKSDNLVRDKISNYKLTIIGRNEMQDSIHGSEIELSYISNGTIDKIIKSQNPFLWGKSLIHKYDYVVPHLVEFDENRLQVKQNQLIFFQPESIILPVDAYISEYNHDTKQYEIVKENPGTKLDTKETDQIIKQAIYQLEKEVSFEDKNCYLEPDIKYNDKTLLQTVKKLNQYVKTEIVYDFVVEQEILDGKQISEWITQDEKQVSLDTDRIKEYIKQISKKYNTYGRDREFVTTSGNMLELPSGGYGWLINQEEEFIQLMQEINNGSVVKREPVYSVRAFTRGKNDIGTTYVEIDLGKQHLYFYQEEKLVLEADFVSGNMVKGFATPPGVFGITYKARNATLRGEDYATPVSYWMPFNGNIGLHDATWRRQFGKDIYLNNGSHGCINLPKEKAAQLYDIVEQGMPVICYY